MTFPLLSCQEGGVQAPLEKEPFKPPGVHTLTGQRYEKKPLFYTNFFSFVVVI